MAHTEDRFCANFAPTDERKTFNTYTSAYVNGLLRASREKSLPAYVRRFQQVYVVEWDTV